MATIIGGLTVDLRAETAAFQGDLARASLSLRIETAKMGRDLERLNGQFRRLGRALQVGLGTLGVGLEFTDLVNQVGRLISEFARLGDRADAIGISAQRLQELSFAAEQSGASAAQMEDALQRLNLRLGLAAEGGGPAADAFDRLDIELRDAQGEVRGVSEVFDDAVAAMEGIESQAELSALASQLFGEEAGPRLATLLRQGTAGIDELAQRARDSGAVLDDALVARAQRAVEAWNRFTTVVGTNAVEAVLRLQGAIESLFAPADLPQQMGLEQAREELERLTQLVDEEEDRLNRAAPMIGRIAFDTLGALVQRRLAVLARIRELEANQPDLPPPPGTVDEEFGTGGGSGDVARVDDPTARAQRFIETLERQVSAVNEQIAALTRSEDQMIRWRTTIEQASIVAAENAEITPQQAQEIRNLTDQLAGSTQQFEEQRAAMEAANEAAREVEQQNQRLAQVFTSFAQSAITDVDNIGDAFERLAGQLVELILEMTVFEQIRSGIEEMDLFGSGSGDASGGGGLFGAIGDFFGGGSGGDSGGGGLFGAIGDFFGGLFMEGGRPPVGRASIVGEDGPEWFIPDVAGTIVPMDAIGGGGPLIGSMSIDARGAERGTAIAIEQAVRRAVGESVTAVQQMARAGRMRDMGFS